jgi:hypothetical protein
MNKLQLLHFNNSVFSSFLMFILFSIKLLKINSNIFVCIIILFVFENKDS